MQYRRFLELSIAATLSAGSVQAQCQLASVHRIDPPPPIPANPLTLETAVPFTFPVLGSAVRLVGPDAPAGWLHGLYFAFGSAVTPLNPPAGGTGLLDASLTAWGPLQGAADWTLPVPAALPPGLAAYFQFLSTDAVTVEVSNALELVTGYFEPELSVVSISTGTSLVGGTPGHPFEVEVLNSGPAPVTTAVEVCIGGFCASALVDVPPLGIGVASVAVSIPMVGATCGASEDLPLSACVQFADCKPANDCLVTTAPVEGAYWDIRLKLVGTPSSVQVFQVLNWAVEARNVGNVTSPNVAYRTGLSTNSSPGSFDYFALFGSTGELAPGDVRTDPWSFFVTPPVFPPTAFLKAEVDPSSGPGDICVEGNFDFVPLTVF